MIAKLHYRHETAGESATLFLSGTLFDGDAVIVHDILTAIPDDVSMVRLDLNALGSFDEDVIEALRPVIRHWGARRGDAFRVSALTASIVTRYAESYASPERVSLCD